MKAMMRFAAYFLLFLGATFILDALANLAIGFGFLYEPVKPDGMPPLAIVRGIVGFMLFPLAMLLLNESK